MEDIINDMSDMVYSIAREFTSNTDLINELYNQGVIGIYDAYKNYNKESNTKFSSYAYMYIYGNMYSYLNQNRNIRINKDVMKLYRLIVKTKDYLCQINYKDVSNKDIASYLNIDESTVNTTLNMVQETLSLDYEYDSTSFDSFIKTDENYKSVELNELLEVLDEEQKKIIYYKYYSGYSQSEIAKIMNMSQSGVSRSEKKSIEKMRIRSKI